MLLGSVVLALLVMVGRLKVMVSSDLVIRCGLKVLLGCFGLRLGSH